MTALAPSLEAFFTHEIPNSGISPQPAYSSAESGKMRGCVGSNPTSTAL
jgi:hypothetical protein